MTALQRILNNYRSVAKSEREKGTYFEELMVKFFQNEAKYKDLYSDVWLYADWAHENGMDARDVGIDLVAKTAGTNELHAIQCKLYAENYKLQKSDIDSFFTASGKKIYSHRIIVCTTGNWSVHAEDAIIDQQPPVTKITLNDLENSQIDWEKYKPNTSVVIKPKKILRPHQIKAFEAVKEGLGINDRGKLIMACGTGKTFTSLKIAEEIAGKGGRVLFLVPSLSLLSQTLTEWTQDSGMPLHSFAVCSDSDVGKKRKLNNDDAVNAVVQELKYPATTNSKRLAAEIKIRHDDEHMTVIFSTYHSIDVISEAQFKYGMDDFDLIICDEAHRTTGATFDNEEESHFVKVHKQDFIKSAKRLYMTATPRLYGNAAKAKADMESIELCSMDDESLYGPTLHTITFSEAVNEGLLVDYKVIVLAIEEEYVSKRIQELLKDENSQINLSDATKIVGCWKALSKQEFTGESDSKPMKRAVAFCQVIEASVKGKKHKVSSKAIADVFQRVIDDYQKKSDNPNDISTTLVCETSHVDGSMNASTKEEKLGWLKEETPENTCRILSNVRCLSEGVDVPALDAVLFLSPRDSQVEVVQSVGRVMRKAPDKKLGYVILPVVIPFGVEPHIALNDNQTYRAVWQVLQALRSHDNRFDAMINKIDLTGPDHKKIEVIAIAEKLPSRRNKNANDPLKKAQKSHDFGKEKYATTIEHETVVVETGEIEQAIYAKLVQKCGTRFYWEDWAADIAKIAGTHIVRIKTIVEDENNVKERAAFQAFAKELRDDINDSITDADVIEMLAQHLVTKPVFDALFRDYSFAAHNPMSKAMQGVLDVLQEHHIEKESNSLQSFYNSVKMRAEGIETAEGKQKIIVELYDKFFRKAFPRMTERLGIVYTPVEVVDFIIHSVNDLLKKEFNQTLGSEGVHIIDPFTGTGTFITRLLQSGLMNEEELVNKYKSQIHANEIVLLAYYIAAINIESTYHGLIQKNGYVPFEGICLTDTFQMYEKEDIHDFILEDNSNRRKKQKELDIRVIIGNPPYSVGQKSANDNNQNITYPHLDARIRSTYAKRTDAANKNSLYDSYIRAIRWASDRIGDNGIIGFVTNAGFIDSNTTDGMRQCLVDEFSSIYIFHLRGNQRTSGELSRMEGGKIFGSGSRAPIAISILVKNPESAEHGQIFFHDIGDYLSREEKLEIISSFNSVDGITESNSWQVLTPDIHGDWLSQRNDSFSKFILMGDKKKKDSKVLFHNYSNGLKTQRDTWCYNFNKNNVSANMSSMIAFYNSELENFNKACNTFGNINRKQHVDNFINTDPTKISWTRALKQDLVNNKTFEFKPESVICSMYRPFVKEWLYFNRNFNEMVYQMPRIFPDKNLTNTVICVTGNAATSGFSTLMTNFMPDVQLIFNSQCFPLYLYEEKSKTASIEDFLSEDDGKNIGGYKRKDAITDDGLKHFLAAYPDEKISKEDIFYYIYGLLHSEEYRDRFADNLNKELPRIPCVKSAADFWAFSKAGRELGKLHTDYESAPMYPATITGVDKSTDYSVTQMKFGKNKDKSTVHYNSKVIISDIPLEAYEYVVNGKSALEWIIERYCFKTDKNSKIVNNANDWAAQTANNPKYILELFLRMITVSIKTLQIVKSLPKLDI